MSTASSRIDVLAEAVIYPKMRKEWFDIVDTWWGSTPNVVVKGQSSRPGQSLAEQAMQLFGGGDESQGSLPDAV